MKQLSICFAGIFFAITWVSAEELVTFRFDSETAPFEATSSHPKIEAGPITAGFGFEIVISDFQYGDELGSYSVSGRSSSFFVSEGASIGSRWRNFAPGEEFGILNFCVAQVDRHRDTANYFEDAVLNGKFLSFEVVPDADVVVNGLKFQASKSINSPNRVVNRMQWQADIGDGFQNIGEELSLESVPKNPHWAEVKVEGVNLRISKGKTATFRLVGYAPESENDFARPLALDAITLLGEVSQGN